MPEPVARPDAGGMDYGLWCQLIGRDEVTGWRWVRDGLVKTENILAVC